MSALPDGYDHLALGQVGSTLDEAQALAAILTVPTWITATHQIAARGRRGRAWVMPNGNFAATLALPLTDSLDQAALRSFVAALALHEACATLTGQHAPFALKWPNDVLLNSGKLAGILLESLQAGGQVVGIAIGIGVNLAEVPDPGTLEPGALPPVSLAGETGAQVTPEDFLAALAPAFARWEEQMRTLGFAPIRAAWLARAARLGETMTARLPGTEITGQFDTVDEQGRLVLSTPDGPKHIAAGDIFF